MTGETSGGSPSISRHLEVPQSTCACFAGGVSDGRGVACPPLWLQPILQNRVAAAVVTLTQLSQPTPVYYMHSPSGECLGCEGRLS